MSSKMKSKVKPAVANDGGDIKFIEFKNGIVKVKLQGSCSGDVQDATSTLKQGVQKSSLNIMFPKT